MTIKLICNVANKDKRDITNIITHVVWSGDIKACGRKLEFKALNKIDIPLSSNVCLYENGKLLFNGYIFEREKESSGNVISYIAFDVAEKMNKIKVSYNFKDTNIHEIAKKVLSDCHFPYKNIAPANGSLTKIFIGTSVYEVIMTAYTEQSKQNNKKYMTICEGNQVSVIEKGIVKLKLAFEEGKNIFSSSFKESICNMVNKVLIVDENGNKQTEITNSDMIKVHGLFQEVYKMEEGKDYNAEAKKMLKGITQTCSLSGFGDTSCQTGYGVQVKDSKTGLIGLFYIDSDTHTWEGGKYTIDLDLNFKNIMNEVQAGEEEDKELKRGTSVVGGRQVQAEFTAYYPANNRMEGGFIDAMGNKLDASKLTCAAPKNLPFGTKIQVKGTGTNKDGRIYTVTDRGGAIKVVNGVYHIDLLVANKRVANQFGRRRGIAIIGGEVVEDSTTSTSVGNTGARVAELAKSKLGCRYVWGATGPNTFDCSGLSSWCFKQVGINIPRTSKEQSRGGRVVARNNIQPGDLVFFNTSGSGVSHVGVYVGGGRMVHAPKPGDVVKYASIDSGYFASRLLRIRRFF